MQCDRLELNSTIVLFGRDQNTKTDICFDEILLKAKFFIYKCRIKKIRPNIQYFKNDLKQLYNIDKYIHSIEMNMDAFYRKWLLYVNLMDQ